MKTSKYQEMSELENSYWWHVGRKSIISQQLKKLGLKGNPKILNIGCGTGGMIPLFEQYGQVTNVDVSGEAIAFCKKLGYKNTIKYNGHKLPFKSSSFDMVVATDVLEHIEDDSGALKEWARVLRPNGHLLITVPAYQWLWSEHDESLHHHRRYTASQLHSKLNRQGYKVIKRSYAISFSFPLIVGYRLLNSLGGKDKSNKDSGYVILPTPINGFFINLLKLEAQVLKYANLPFGTSIIIIAKNNSPGNTHPSL